ncbi:hypothetical protein SAMN04487996_112255 [Dyadobacter soli]|uniref:Uncharacterized protein n=1 Tax=Dyadobacter soli TaxID=659014 RepID=A0A1G7P4I6_9BACT|nr:hypothetical protein SAMN04487996_112255 [Dyadobacter soli]
MPLSFYHLGEFYLNSDEFQAPFENTENSTFKCLNPWEDVNTL